LECVDWFFQLFFDMFLNFWEFFRICLQA
jgi:hypothetical protein